MYVHARMFIDTLLRTYVRTCVYTLKNLLSSKLFLTMYRVEACVFTRFMQIALTVMWMQKGKPNWLCKSAGIRTRYCIRTVPVQVLEKKLLTYSCAKDAPCCGRVSLRDLTGVLYARIITSACALQHSCWPTHIFTHIHTFTHTHIHTHTFTYTHIRRYSQTFTHICTHWNAFTYTHTHTYHAHIHIYTHIHTYTHIQAFTNMHTHTYL